MAPMPVNRFAILLLGLALTAGGAGAATFTPTTTTDGFDGACNAHCTLREAIAAANATPGPDLVHLGPGVYELTRAGANEDAGATGDLDVTSDLELAGDGAASTIIDGRGLDRVLQVLGTGRLRVADLTVRNGRVIAEPGGGICAEGELAIRRVVVAGSQASVGGGVYAAAELEVADSTFVDNSASTSGGGVHVDGAARLEELDVFRQPGTAGRRPRPAHLQRDRPQPDAGRQRPGGERALRPGGRDAPHRPAHQGRAERDLHDDGPGHGGGSRGL